MYLFKIAFFLVFILSVGYSQHDSISNHEYDTEDFLPESETSEESEILIITDDLSENPIDLNTGTVKELQGILNKEYVKALEEYRQRHGPILSTGELYMIREIPSDVVKRIKNFVTVDDNVLRKSWYSDFKFSFRSRVRKNNPAYDDWGNLNRLKVSMGDKITAGFLTEKDQGERSLYDFYSGYIQFREIFYTGSIVLGDFNFENGQGLINWGPYSALGGNTIESAYKRGRGILPYTGSNESVFLRGIGTDIFLNNFYLTAYYSGRKLDALIDSAGNAVSIYSYGMHRTSGETKRREMLGTKTKGMSIGYYSGFLNAGLSLKNISTEHLYNGRNNFTGYSGDFDLLLSGTNIFGEVAYSGSSALITGINTALEDIELTVAYRKFNTGYFWMNNPSFEETGNDGETGLYSGVKTRSSFGEALFSFEQVSYLSSGRRLTGYNLNLNLISEIREGVTLNLRYRLGSRDLFYNYEFTKKNRQNFRADIGWGKKLSKLKIRCDLVLVTIKNSLSEKGFCIQQDMKHSITSWLSMNFRAAYFRTDSFYSAVYQYEAGIPGLLENKVLYGEGLRYNIFLKFTGNKLPSFYLKYSGTLKNENDQGNSPEIIMQLEWSYK